MSAKTWAAEYCGKLTGAKRWTDKQCFEHTIKKYSGAVTKILREHNLHQAMSHLIPIGKSTLGVDDIPPAEKFTFSESTCALCVKYKNQKYKNPCAKCPLSIVGKECVNGDATSPYDVFCDEKDPYPMIRTMKKMLQQCDAKGNWEL